jgi:hypothetical protein
MFVRIARIVVLGLALTMVGGNTAAVAGGIAAANGHTAQAHVAHMAGDDHFCC